MTKTATLIGLFTLGLAACAPPRGSLNNRVMSKTISEDGTGATVTKNGVGPRWATRDVTFSFDPSATQPIRTACRSAAQTINAALDRPVIRFSPLDKPFVASVPDGHNVIAYGKPTQMGDADVGKTMWYHSGATMQEADIDFAPLMIASGVDVETVCLHELGHAMGLTHVTDRASVMYEVVSGPQIKRRLSAGDVRRLRRAFPSATATEE